MSFIFDISFTLWSWDACKREAKTEEEKRSERERDESEKKDGRFDSWGCESTGPIIFRVFSLALLEIWRKRATEKESWRVRSTRGDGPTSKSINFPVIIFYDFLSEHPRAFLTAPTRIPPPLWKSRAYFEFDLRLVEAKKYGVSMGHFTRFEIISEPWAISISREK